MIRLAASTVAAAIVMAASAAYAQTPPDTPETPAANPGRPTVATPAALTPVGYLQFETGIAFAKDSPNGVSSRFGVNNVTKLAVNKRIQLLGSFEPAVRSRVDDVVLSQAGGVSAGVQVVIAEGSNGKKFGASYFRSLYDGTAPDLDVGSATQTLLLLASGDFSGFHADFNIFLNDQETDTGHRLQNGVTLCVSHAAGPITIAGELWTFSQPLLAGRTIATLWAASYSVRPNLVIDAAVNYGFRSTSTRWQLLAGFTYLLPKKLK
jgi:hypothetical protein